MVVEAALLINVVALVIAHSRKSDHPSLTFVFGNINANVVTVVADAGGIEDVGIRRGEGEVDHAVSDLRQEAVALQGVASASVVNKVIHVAAHIDVTVDSGSDGVVGTDRHSDGISFNGG